MTNSSALRELIHKSGIKYKHLAEKLCLTPYGLQKKIDNETEFKASEIKRLCEILCITELSQRDAIFFYEEQ